MTPFLAEASLVPLWRAVRGALDRNGLDWRGTLALPELTPEGRRRLGIVLGRHVGSDRRRVSLTELEAGVRRLAAEDLVTVLTGLGWPPEGRWEAARARADEKHARRAALDEAVGDLLRTEAWAREWAAAAWSGGVLAGYGPEAIEAAVDRVRAVLALGGTGRSRSDVAARLLGDAHALDSDTRLARLVTRALVARDGPADEREAWERAGMPLDLVSAPVLVWGLPLVGDDGPAVAARAMTAAGLPLHLSVLALRASPPRVARGTPVLVVENPRLVEAAAELRLPAAVLCTNGNPTTAPTEALAALRAAAADLRYHGDFDAAGLAIAGRVSAAECRPFLMSAHDYRQALAVAADTGVELPRDDAAPPATPWDPALAAAFDEHRLVVHEERVMDEVLRAHAAQSHAP